MDKPRGTVATTKDPVCGMALELKTATLTADNTEYVDMARRFWISVALTVPVFALAMGYEFTPGLIARIVSGRALGNRESARKTR